MNIIGTIWILDITDWWRQEDITHWKYADLSNVGRDISSIIPHGVGLEVSVSVGQDVIGWRQSKTTGGTLREKLIVSQFASYNNRVLAGADPKLNTTNKENASEMKKEGVERTLHRIAKVHDFLEMWQGSQNLHATLKKFLTWNKQMTAVGYISDIENIIKASWSLFDYDGAAAFQLSERSPLPSALSAKDLPGRETQILNVRWIRIINRHPVKSREVSAPQRVSTTDDWLNWNGNLDDPNDREDYWVVDVQYDSEQDTSIEDPQCSEQQNVSSAPHVHGFIPPTWRSKR